MVMSRSLFFSLLLITSSSSAIACTQVQQPVYDPVTYYASVTGQNVPSLTGASLKASLNLMIRNHTYYSYSPCTWEILKQADQHPTDSSSVIGIYTRRAIPKADQDAGSNTPDYWNREHMWPKSHGFPSKSQYAHTDVHMLRASDKSVNADRGNRDFANGGVTHYECSQCKSTSTTWEPPDEVKGDIARAMFYADTRYEGGDNSGVGDLELLDHTTNVGQPALGVLCDMIQWHIDDPVSAEEVQRNHIVYSWQGNRNPFVDHPEFVIPIWGGTCGISVPVENDNDDNDVPLPLWAMMLLFASLGLIPGLIKKKG